MQIVRVTIRTFQSVEHAELFLSVGSGVKQQLSNAGLKAKFSICRVFLCQIKSFRFGIMMIKSTCKPLETCFLIVQTA